MKITTSDPGTSASLTPFCKTDGLFFDSEHEPESFKYEYDKDLHDTFDDDNCMVKPSFNSLEEYFNYNLGIDEIVDRFNINETERGISNIVLVPVFDVQIGGYEKNIDLSDYTDNATDEDNEEDSEFDSYDYDDVDDE